MQNVSPDAVEEGEVEDGELPAVAVTASAPASASQAQSTPSSSPAVKKTIMAPKDSYGYQYASSLGAPRPPKMQIGIGLTKGSQSRQAPRSNPLDNDLLPKGPRSMYGGASSSSSSSAGAAAGIAIKGAATSTTSAPVALSAAAVSTLPTNSHQVSASTGSGLAIKGRSNGDDRDGTRDAPSTTMNVETARAPSIHLSQHAGLPPRPSFASHAPHSLSIKGANSSGSPMASKPRLGVAMPFKSKSQAGPNTLNMLGSAQSKYQAPSNAIGKGYGNAIIVPKAAAAPVAAADPGPSYTPPPRGSMLPARPITSPKPPAAPRPISPIPPPPPPAPRVTSPSPKSDSHSSKEKGKGKETEEGEEGEELEEGEEDDADLSSAVQRPTSLPRRPDVEDSQNSRTSHNRDDRPDFVDDDRRGASFGASQDYRDRYDMDNRSPRSSRFYERDYGGGSSRRHYDTSDDRWSRRREDDHHQERHHIHSDDRHWHRDHGRREEKRRDRDRDRDDDRHYERHRHRHSQHNGNGNGNVWRRGSSYSPDADRSRKEPDFHDEPGAPRHVARVTAQIKPSQPPTPAADDGVDSAGRDRRSHKGDSSRAHQPPQLPQASTPFFLPTPPPSQAQGLEAGVNDADDAGLPSLNDSLDIATGSGDPKLSHAAQTFTLFGASPLSDYVLEEKLGEGTFGVVHKARRKEGSVRVMSQNGRNRRSLGNPNSMDPETGVGVSKVQVGDVVALKKIVMHNDMDGVPITALREIRILKSLDHPNVVSVVDMAYQEGDYASMQRGAIYMVFPYMAHDLAGLLENKKIERLEPSLLKLYARQLLLGTSYLHRNRILHRDMKAANLLLSDDGVLQIADFGLARSIEDPSDGRKREYTNCVVTRWYRPPELLLGLRAYGTAIDMWGVGCVIGEMFFRHPVFTGSSDLDQLARIVQMCGTIDDNSMPGWDQLPDSKSITLQRTARNVKREFSRFSDELADLLDKLLVYNTEIRLTADQALDHEWFWSEPLPAEIGSVKVFPSSHEYDKRKAQEEKQGQGGDKARAAQEAAFKGPNRPVRPAAAPVVQPLRQAAVPTVQELPNQGAPWTRPGMPAMQMQMQPQMQSQMQMQIQAQMQMQQMQQQASNYGMQAMPTSQLVRPAGLPPRPTVALGGPPLGGPAFPDGSAAMGNGAGYPPHRSMAMNGNRMPSNGTLPERPLVRNTPPTKEMSIVGRSGNGWDQGDPASKRRKLSSPPGRLSGGIAGRARGSGQVESFMPFKQAGVRASASAYNDDDVPAGSAEPSDF